MAAEDADSEWLSAATCLGIIFLLIHHLFAGGLYSAFNVIAVAFFFVTVDSNMARTDFFADVNADTAATGAAILLIGQILAYLGQLPLTKIVPCAKSIVPELKSGPAAILAIVAIALCVLSNILIYVELGDSSCCSLSSSQWGFIFVFAISVFGPGGEAAHTISLFAGVIVQYGLMGLADNNGSDTLQAAGILGFIGVWLGLIDIILFLWPGMIGSK